MTLKEELEILRGEPIKVFTDDPMSIPCIETSDPEKLCKHPVVSVSMITYNHEPYIRQAIEGVMMQRTDFEFELIIGEDCSQDKTREICFEYQKKYPDKIRVLWWHENVSKLGGNGRRCAARRRGEFIALCEGDDCWIDPLKLQKQVDIMRKCPNVGLCFCGAKQYWQEKNLMEDRQYGAFEPGMIAGRKFLLYHLFGADPSKMPGPEGFIMTATTMYRASAGRKAARRFDVFNWRLYLGDKTLFYGLSSVSDVYFMGDRVAVYRRAATGVMTTQSHKVFRDSALLRMYYPIESLGLGPRDIPASVYGIFAREQPLSIMQNGFDERLRCAFGLFKTRFWVCFLNPLMLLWWISLWSSFSRRCACFVIHRYLRRRTRVSGRLAKLYLEVNDG